jgi:hypothetical protein
MTLYDHAENFRSYDFTELFKFQPFASSSKKAAQASSNISPLTFEVIATHTGASAVKQLGIPEAQSGEVPSIFSAWGRTTEHLLSSRTSRAKDWIANRISEAVRLVDQWVSPTVAGGLTSMWQQPARDVTATSSRLDAAATVVSQGEDPLTGSRYRVIRTLGSSDSQQWTLEYRSNTGTVFATRNLPTTSEVLWRGRFENAHLSTTAWTRVCADRVWTVQDGYELLFHVGDRALQELRPGRLWADQSAETSVVTDVRCTFGGAIWVEGYAFGVSGDEPPLRRSDVQATRFGFALDRFGGLVKRQVQSAPFDVTGLCAAAANEQQMFCDEAKRAVGW